MHKLFITKKSIPFVIVVLLFYSCKTQKHDDPITNMYSANYENQYRHVVDVVNTKESANKLALTYLSIWYKDKEVDFNEYESLTIDSVNDDKIWRVKMVRSEHEKGYDNPKYDVTNYFVFIRKKDGAMLYIRREKGEWVGTIELYERLYEERMNKTNNPN